MQLDREKFYSDKVNKDRKQSAEEYFKREDLRLKEKKIDTDLKIAKENKNQFDKSK